MTKLHPVAVAALAAALLASPVSAADRNQKSHFRIVWRGHREFSFLTAKEAGNNPGCGGGNISPALSWSGAPATTKSYALEIMDPDSPSLTGFVHWLAYDIPASKTSLKEGEGSQPSTEFKSGKNGPGRTGYFGPCPPVGDTPHPYAFLLIATDLPPGALQDGMTRDDLAAALKGHVLARTTTIYMYGR